jgi:hypothetical protein
MTFSAVLLQKDNAVAMVKHMKISPGEGTQSHDTL